MPEIETSGLIKALLMPDAYLHRPHKVELAQTQMSLVFMTGQFAYKIKKPVNLGYLDYTTLEKRFFFCQQEVKLNRRLCPEVYLGVAPVCRKGDSLVVEGEGEVVEYAVKMLQLPQHRMMDVLLERNQVTEDMVKQVAAKMARFHREAETSPAISAFGSLDAIEANTGENFSQTEKYIGKAVPVEEFEAIKDYMCLFIKKQAPLFRRRVRDGRIRDCHGDLHAANICFTDGLVIYDCIEFNDRFRYCDVASEIAFLAMDMDFHKRPELSKVFNQTYIQLSGDTGIEKCLDFYKGYRACVRGKVECFKSEDKLVPPADRERALLRAQAYFKLAYSYIAATPGTSRRTNSLAPRGRELERGGRRLYLFITVGLVGTGKTAVAEALARKLGLNVVSSDVMRKKLAGIPVTERHYDEFDKGLYSVESTRRTYDALFEEADRLLSEGKSVILDASFRKAEERLKAENVARVRNAQYWIIEVTCPEDVVRQRLEQRLRQTNVPSDGRWEVYVAQKKDFKPIKPDIPQIRVDTSQPLDKLIEQITRQLNLHNQSPNSRRRR